MSDQGLESPEADAAEQEQGVVPEEPDEDAEPQDLPLEASPGDAAEQAREVRPDDDDEYR